MNTQENPMETAALISRCREGDESAVETLVNRFQKPLYRLALSILEDPAEAEEAAQDALLAALGALDSFRGQASLNTWLHAITVNICRSRLRKRQARRRLWETLHAIFRLAGDAPGGSPAHPEDTVIHHEADRHLWNAIHTLDEKHRLPVILRYYHDLPVAEIARILNVNEGTIHSRLSVARDRLRSQLETLQETGSPTPRRSLR
jgi:RNA polymerase sigma-70 factor (ECF subfamily)